jgi:membrane protein
MATLIGYLRRVWGNFQSDECPFLAGAVAYQLFFALIPMVLLLVGVLAFFLDEERVKTEAASLLAQVIPITGERRLIDDLVEGRALSLGIGLVGTIWGVTAIHAALDRALQGVFGRASARPFIRDKLSAVLFASFLLLVAALSFVVPFAVQTLSGWLDRVGLEAAQRAVLQVLSPLWGLLAGVVLFFLIYRAVPRRRLPVRAIGVGAVVAAVLWEVAKAAFAVWVRELGGFRSYGALALAAGLLTWIYLSALIVLIGAEVIKARHEGPR